MIENFEKCTEFQWDLENKFKNSDKHNVLWQECEQIFFNAPLLVQEDQKHSQTEKRFYALGETDNGRKLMIVFTIRKNSIRVISARDMSKKERRFYHEKSS